MQLAVLVVICPRARRYLNVLTANEIKVALRIGDITPVLHAIHDTVCIVGDGVTRSAEGFRIFDACFEGLSCEYIRVTGRPGGANFGNVVFHSPGWDDQPHSWRRLSATIPDHDQTGIAGVLPNVVGRAWNNVLERDSRGRGRRCTGRGTRA